VKIIRNSRKKLLIFSVFSIVLAIKGNTTVTINITRCLPVLQDGDCLALLNNDRSKIISSLHLHPNNTTDNVCYRTRPTHARELSRELYLPPPPSLALSADRRCLHLFVSASTRRCSTPFTPSLSLSLSLSVSVCLSVCLSLSHWLLPLVHWLCQCSAWRRQWFLDLQSSVIPSGTLAYY